MVLPACTVDCRRQSLHKPTLPLPHVPCPPSQPLSLPLSHPPQATEDLQRLREALDSQSLASPLMQLQQRTWLMHWALHVFWNTEAGKTALIDLFLQPAYMSAIQVGGGGGLRM